MTYKTQESGLGLVAMLAIVAILAVGGTVAYQMSQDATVEMNDDEMFTNNESEAAADIKSQTAELRTELNTGAVVDVAVAQRILANIKADLLAMKSKVDAQAAAELDALEERLVAVEADIEATGEVAAAELESVLADIDAKIDAMLEAGSNAEADMDAAGGTNESGDSQTEDMESSEDGDTGETGATVDATSEAGIEMDDTQIEVDGTATGELSI